MYVVEREKKDLRITLCDTCEGAVAGTDYIVTTLRVGGDHSRVQDERAALKCGSDRSGNYRCRRIFYGSKNNSGIIGLLQDFSKICAGK